MRAPLAGAVVQKLVLPGQFIQAGTTAAFVISNTSTVWVQGHVYDKDLAVGARRRQGRRAKLVVSRSVPRHHFLHRRHARSGDADDAGPHRDAEPERAAEEGSVRRHGDSRQDDARRARRCRRPRCCYDEQNLPFVYVQARPGQFAQRLVKLGGQQGDETQIVERAQGRRAGRLARQRFLQFANTYQS